MPGRFFVGGVASLYAQWSGGNRHRLVQQPHQRRSWTLRGLVSNAVVLCDTRPSYVFTWGNGLQGQLGHGDHANRSVPTLVDSLSLNEIKQCSCGTFHTACVAHSGKMFTWGRGDHNQLGHRGLQTDQAVPKELQGFRGTKVVCGDAYTVALTEEGEVLSWGRNNRGQCGRRPRPRQPSNNNLDACPDANATSYRPVSSSLWKKTSSETPPNDVWSHRRTDTPETVGRVEGFPVGTHITDIACGKHHAVALAADSTVYVWGQAAEGQAGLGSTVVGDIWEATPLPRAAFDHKRVVQVVAGNYSSGALTEDGSVYTWGSDQYGQLGHGRESRHVFVPRRVQALAGHKITRLASGQYHMAAVTSAGDVFTWGYGRDGQLGHGRRDDVTLPTRVEPLGVRNVHVACGGGHTAVLQEDTDTPRRVLQMFGRGRDGQLGRADHLESIVDNRPSPVMVDALRHAGYDIDDVVCGQDFTLAICSRHTTQEKN